MNKEQAYKIGLAFKLGMIYARGKAHARKLTTDKAEWITVHPNGKENKGRPALIDSTTGQVLGGMGGKFNGKHISIANSKSNKPALLNNQKMGFYDVEKEQEKTTTQYNAMQSKANLSMNEIISNSYVREDVTKGDTDQLRTTIESIENGENNTRIVTPKNIYEFKDNKWTDKDGNTVNKTLDSVIMEDFREFNKSSKYGSEEVKEKAESDTLLASGRSLDSKLAEKLDKKKEQAKELQKELDKSSGRTHSQRMGDTTRRNKLDKINNEIKEIETQLKDKAKQSDNKQPAENTTKVNSFRDRLENRVNDLENAQKSINQGNLNKLRDLAKQSDVSKSIAERRKEKNKADNDKANNIIKGLNDKSKNLANEYKKYFGEGTKDQVDIPISWTKEDLLNRKNEFNSTIQDLENTQKQIKSEYSKMTNQNARKKLRELSQKIEQDKRYLQSYVNTFNERLNQNETNNATKNNQQSITNADFKKYHLPLNQLSKIEKETDKAFLISSDFASGFDGDDIVYQKKSVWVPKSQVSSKNGYVFGMNPKWAKENGFTTQRSRELAKRLRLPSLENQQNSSQTRTQNKALNTAKENGSVASVLNVPDASKWNNKIYNYRNGEKAVFINNQKIVLNAEQYKKLKELADK